jgi:hypothetical protein
MQQIKKQIEEYFRRDSDFVEILTDPSYHGDPFYDYWDVSNWTLMTRYWQQYVDTREKYDDLHFFEHITEGITHATT